MKLANQVAIVTGAAGAGIGHAAALALAQEGANVVVTDSHHQRPITIAEEIGSICKVTTLGLQCDVTDGQQVKDMVEKALDRFGTIDILVNNAGFDRVEPFVEMEEQTWELILNVNLRGNFYCTKAVLPTMIKQQRGRIINLSSIAAWVDTMDSVAYSAAKAGIASLTRALAREVGQYNITVNAIAPGIVMNPFLEKVVPREELEGMVKFTALGRAGQPMDIAKVIVFLASEDASYITGETICVTGGWFSH